MPKSDDNMFKEHQENVEPAIECMSRHGDLTMESILNNLNTTPLGKVLKRISAMPEVRKEKVLEVRRSISNGEYDLNVRLDQALEKVLNNLDF